MSLVSTRCPACRGRKQVEKLGGILGNCNTCDGKGVVDGAGLCAPSAFVHDAVYGSVVTQESKQKVIDAVAKVTPIAVGEPTPMVEVKEGTPIVQAISKGNRTIYKRKRG